MTTVVDLQKTSPKEILRRWAKKNGITPAALAEQSRFTYNHAWKILSGGYPITLETLGRLLLVYGQDGPALEMAEAMRNELDHLALTVSQNGKH